MGKHVVFLGSYMHCIFAGGAAIPRAGETLTGDHYVVDYGGKGSTQAMAAAVMGTDVKYIGKLGDDPEGQQAIDLFDSFGLIETDRIEIDPGSHTGIALILTDHAGNNAISVVPGVNNRFTQADIDRHEAVIRGADLMAFVLETNYEAVAYGVKKAHALGVKTFLDPSPAMAIGADVYACLDYIKPNEYEATVLTGIEVTDPESAVLAGRAFLDKGVGTAVVTLGALGTVLVTRDGSLHFRTPAVDVVDTTSAGDVFGGTFISLVSQGAPLDEAIAYASCAGALATTVAYPILDVIPTREAIEAQVRTYKAAGDYVTAIG